MHTYIQIDHTADIAYKLNGKELSDLLLAGFEALLDSTLASRNLQPDEQLPLSFNRGTFEEILVDFLSEVNYLITVKKWAPLKISKVDLISNDDYRLNIKLHGCSVAERPEIIKEEIKAVTYHQLDIVKTDSGYKTIIVFDI